MIALDPVVPTVRLRLELVDPSGDSWGRRRIVRSFDDLVVGDVEFYGSPAPADDGVTEVEVAFALRPEARGHGAGTETLQGVLAQTDALGVRVRARVAPANRAAVRVLATCGFTLLRGGDEDGNLVMARPLAVPGGRAASDEDGGRAASDEDGGRAASDEDGGRAASEASG